MTPAFISPGNLYIYSRIQSLTFIDSLSIERLKRGLSYLIPLAYARGESGANILLIILIYKNFNTF